MSDDKKDEPKKSTLSLGSKGTLSLKGKAGGGSGLVQQSFSGGRSKTVAVEVRRRRGGEAAPTDVQADTQNANDPMAGLSPAEKEKRLKALEAAQSGLASKSALPPRVKKTPKFDEPEETVVEETTADDPTPATADAPKKTKSRPTNYAPNKKPKMKNAVRI